ncbi:MAG: carbohydrate ABC transporter permease [Vigna little leaf phytoplasma]|nr:carbohydrate ABC transporter permease [Vigna little leaf phytoplasma]
MNKNKIFLFVNEIWNQLKIQYKKIKYLSILKYFFLFLVSLVLIFPFFLMFNFSLKSNEEIIENSILSLPKCWYNFDNYRKAYEFFNFFRYFLNTCIMVFFSTLLGTLCCILTAFALSMFNFRSKSIIISLLILSLMITSETLVLTNYRTVSSLGMVNNGKGSDLPGGVYFAMVLPYIVNVVHILILIKTFKIIPKELYYTAKIDGTTDWQYLWKILVPITKGTLLITIIFRIVAAWNAYSWPELVGGEMLTNMSRKKFNNETGIDEVNVQMAVAVLINLPLFFIFVFFKKYIVSGDNSSGIKG